MTDVSVKDKPTGEISSDEFCLPRGFTTVLRCQSCGYHHQLVPGVGSYEGWRCAKCESQHIQLQVEPSPVRRAPLMRYTARGEHVVNVAIMLAMSVFLGACFYRWWGGAITAALWGAAVYVDAWAKRA